MSELAIEAHGARYLIGDIGDGVVGRSLRAGHPYEARVLEHIYRRGFTGTAIDAGAHVGNHALWLAAVCGLRVYAAEPITFDDLAANVERNGLSIEIWPFALGDRDRSARNAGRGRVRGEGDIPVRRLDDQRVEGPVSLLKVDVEGMEAEVLRGGLKLIGRERPVIYAEAWNREAHDRVAEVLLPLGYEHRKTFGATPLEEWECSR